MKYSCDFETTTDPNDCRVWATGICEIPAYENFNYGNNIDFFFDFFQNHKNATAYFHNLRFDGEFIFNYLFRNDYKWVDIDLKTKLRKNQFTTTIDGKNKVYMIKIWLSDDNTLIIYDSLKIIPLSVKEMAKAFGLEIKKGEIDYSAYREIGHELTQEEIEYLNNDVQIVSQSLNFMFEQGLNKMTQAGNALMSYKQIIGKKKFNYNFPPPEYDAEVRLTYKGAFTYANERFTNQEIGEGIVLDVNSLYPWVMRYCNLPYGEGIHFEGDYIPDKNYPLYTLLVTFEFELKENYLPIIQIKNGYSGIFCPTEYLKSSNGEEVVLAVTCVDWELIKEHYHVFNVTIHGGWKFRSSNLLFAEYIDKWTEVKIQATKKGNKGLRQVAKNMLNSLYGKFATSPIVDRKCPVYIDGQVAYQRLSDEYRKPLYIPVGSFITAWARNKTIRSAQASYDRFLYADTDSLHLIGLDMPEGLEIDDTKLGAWKHEGTFKRAKYIRAKSYVEEMVSSAKEIDEYLTEHPECKHHVNFNDSTILKITCAGMPAGCYKNVSFDNFKRGSVYGGKLQLKHTVGGMYLKDIDFTLKM